MPVSRPKVVVVGSLNVDYIASVENLPGPGETVAASGLVMRFGGKGANQAVAAARQGARVAMLGYVGDDEAGRTYRRRLRAEGIDVTGIATAHDALTGTALIAVDGNAENLIVVAAGANGRLSPAAIRAERERISSANILLLQFEVPMGAVMETVRLGNRAKVPIILNPSPLRVEFPWGKYNLSTLIVNAGEARQIFGMAADSLPARLPAWRRGLIQYRIEQLILTRGPDSTLCVTADKFFEVPGLMVKPVDTVGAGDAFAGTFAARRAEGATLRACIQYGNCSGALATLRRGAQEAIPSRAATEKAFARYILRNRRDTLPNGVRPSSGAATLE